MSGGVILAGALWEWLERAGGVFALSFIVALALSLVGMALVYLTSAVVVLDRFARTANEGRWIAVCGGAWALLCALVAARGVTPETLDLAVDPGRLAWAMAGIGAGGTLLCMAGVRLLLGAVRPANLGLGACLTLAVGYTLLVAGIGNLAAALAAAVLAAVVGLGLRQRGRATGERRRGEPWAFGRAVLVAAGAALAAALAEPHFWTAAVGIYVLGGVFALVWLGLLPLAAAGLLSLRGRLEWFVGTRYLFAKRRQTFISVISLICVGGVATGVWLIITVMSVMNGFATVWRDEVIGNRAHFTIYSHEGRFGDYDAVLETVARVPEIVAASPFLDAEGMVRGEGGRIVGVKLRGIDPARLGAVGELDGTVVEGSLDDLAPRATDGGAPLPGIVVGHALAQNLGLVLGQPLVVISPFGGPQTPLGPAPRLKRFRVAGVFESSLLQYDQVFTYVDLQAAQDFVRAEDVVEGVLVRVTDFLRSRPVGTAAVDALGWPYYALDWKQFFPSFFQALKTERVMMFILLMMIVVVAAFMIVATLIMMIMEKSSDIAILKTMGADEATIERIFAIEGTMIGLAGTVLGVVAGMIVTTQLDWIQRWVETLFGIDVLPQNVYPLSHFPWEFDAVQITIVITLSMVLSLGATLLPSRQGARLDPAEALRYE